MCVKLLTYSCVVHQGVAAMPTREGKVFANTDTHPFRFFFGVPSPDGATVAVVVVIAMLPYLCG